MADLSLLKRHKTFGGWTEFYSHQSRSTRTPMRFGVYLPPQAEKSKLPVLYFLSGLTCTEENFLIKAGAQRYAAEHGVILVAPDTSPRGAGVPGEAESWDFGLGAGFYLNATEPGWKDHYRMYDYVVDELPELIERAFPVRRGQSAIMGHSMGGHGALVIALRNQERYASVSALAPICAPSRSPWGKKAFSRYLGRNEATWKAYDASDLVRQFGSRLPLLVDQGGEDEFLHQGQLQPDALREACQSAGVALDLRLRPGYDHSYYFISSVIGEHVEYHARRLS